MGWKVFFILTSVGPEDQCGGICGGIGSYQRGFKYELLNQHLYSKLFGGRKEI